MPRGQILFCCREPTFQIIIGKEAEKEPSHLNKRNGSAGHLMFGYLGIEAGAVTGERFDLL